MRLNNSNPELVTDFEEFICDMSTEVESAQNALKYMHCTLSCTYSYTVHVL